MPPPLDPYHTWLGIPPAEQPPHFYRLLGVPPLESDMSVIGHASDRQIAYVKTFLDGPHAELAQRVLMDLREARLCLFDAEKKEAYDAELRERLAGSAASNPRQDAARPAPRSWLKPWGRTDAASAAVLPPEAAPPLVPPPAATPVVVPVAAPALQPAEEIVATGNSVGTKMRTRQGMPSELLLIAGGGLALLLGVLALLYMLSGPATDKDKLAEKGKKPASTKTKKDDKRKTAIVPMETKPDEPKEPASEPAEPAEKPEVKPLEPTPETSTPNETEPVKGSSLPTIVVAERLGVPKSEDQTAATSQLREVFKDEYARARTPDEKLVLAGKLLSMAKNLKKEPSNRYVTLREAFDSAVAGGGFVQARQAIDTMAESYDVDPLKLRSHLLTKINPNVRTNEQRRELANEALALVTPLVTDRRFDDAHRAADLAGQLAERLADAQLRVRARAANVEVRTTERDWLAVQPALDTLKSTPDDPAANTTVGKHLCLVVGDYALGLSHLAKGEDEALRALAVSDLAGLPDAEAQVKLADGWYDLGAGDEKLAGFQARAAAWYRHALPELGGLQKSRIEKRLSELAAKSEVIRLLDKPGVNRVGAPASDAELSIKERKLLSGHRQGARFVVFSPDRKTLVSAGADKTIKLWDLATDSERLELKGHTDDVTAIVVSTDGRGLVSSSLDGAVGLWNIAVNTKPLALMKGTSSQVACVAATSDGKNLASLGVDGNLSLWDLATRRERQSIKAHDGGGAWIAFAPDGKRFATAGADKTVKIWSALGQLEATLDHAASVSAIAFSPDGKLLASGGTGKSVELWNAEKPERIRSLSGHAYAIVALAFSQGGEWLASADSTGAILIWDPATGKEKAKVAARQTRVGSVAFSHDGRTLATAHDSGSIVLYDLTVKRAAPTTADRGELELPTTK